MAAAGLVRDPLKEPRQLHAAYEDLRDGAPCACDDYGECLLHYGLKGRKRREP